MKTSLRILMMVLVMMVAVSSLSYAGSASKNPGRSSKARKRGEETGFYSRQMNQAKYSKCPRFSTQKRAFK